jgi:Polyketide cyclase / dehydrase and lipid transport
MLFVVCVGIPQAAALSKTRLLRIHLQKGDLLWTLPATTLCQQTTANCAKGKDSLVSEDKRREFSMPQLLIYALYALAGGVLIIAFMALMKPDNFRISRNLTMDAPAARVFAEINNLDNWTHWSPWQFKDPSMKQTYGPTREGKGAWMEWSGNKQVGSGRMTITDAQALNKVLMQLDFQAPMKATNMAEFTLTEQDGHTTVTWTMTGTATFVSKVFDVLMNMDRMVGNDFEGGLGNLKKRVEA